MNSRSVVIGAFIVSTALIGRASIQTRPTVLDNVRVIDGTGQLPIEQARVVIEVDRIRHIGTPAQVPLPPQAETIDLSGRTIMPGLIPSAHSGSSTIGSGVVFTVARPVSLHFW